MIDPREHDEHELAGLDPSDELAFALALDRLCRFDQRVERVRAASRGFQSVAAATEPLPEWPAPALPVSRALVGGEAVFAEQQAAVTAKDAGDLGRRVEEDVVVRRANRRER